MSFPIEQHSEHHKKAWAFAAKDAREYLFYCDKGIIGDHFPFITYSKKDLQLIHLKPSSNDPEAYVCLCDIIEYHLEHGGEDPVVPAAEPGGGDNGEGAGPEEGEEDGEGAGLPVDHHAKA